MNKKLVIGLTSATLALGAVASIGMMKNAGFEAKADSHSFGIIGSFEGNDWVSDKYTFGINDSGDYEVTAYIPAGVEFKIRADGGWTWSVGYDQFSRNTGYDTWFSRVTGGNSDNNAKVNTGYSGNYTFVLNKGIFDYGDKSYGIDIKVETTCEFIAYDGGAGTSKGSLDYNTETFQFEGVITLDDGDKFKVRKTVAETPTDYSGIEGLPSSVATSAGGWVTIVNGGTYIVYLKSDGNLWIDPASAKLVSYAYAGYFLTNIGCHQDGQSVPTGWDDCATRYGKLTDDAKDYIFSFDIAGAEDGENDNIVKMIRRYEWAINHNPNNLPHFIVNRSGTERPSSLYNNATSNIATDNNSSVSTWALAAIAGSALLASGAFFLLRRKNEE